MAQETIEPGSTLMLMSHPYCQQCGEVPNAEVPCHPGSYVQVETYICNVCGSWYQDNNGGICECQRSH